ncbi:MAG: endonuclease III [Candidatus Omnitrophica bacterium]|nr:endonuclease III [Candidatus Omnitrophota bacterium]
MRIGDLKRVFRILDDWSSEWTVPVVTLVALTGKGPFRVLISCLLSLRTQDETTAGAVRRLFEVADTPGTIAALPVSRIEKLIYPVGFYKTKAGVLKRVSEDILRRHGGRVPDDMEELLRFKGVGRKTANLVLSEGFGQDAICVDTHVHRITNRWGLVQTPNPEATEFALRKVLPRPYWRTINKLLVAFGQQHCRPLSPHCSLCRLTDVCPKIGVTRRR